MPFFYKKVETRLDDVLLTNYIKSVTIENNRHLIVTSRTSKKFKSFFDLTVSIYQRLRKKWKKKTK